VQTGFLHGSSDLEIRDPMATSEIEKLERRYAENPQGLTFAPLAEVHRKSGDVARALELLRAGLELHPNYIPASIVLGRCHWDQGDLPAAESAFAHVLRLDDENVIALKSLADINERLERWGEAQRWLQRLVSVDRSNEEAREQLSRLEAAAKDRSARPAAPAAQPAASSNLPHEIDAAESTRTAPAPSPPAAAAPAPPAPAEPAALDLTAAIADPTPKAASAEPKAPAIEFLDISAPGKSEPPTEPVEVGKSEPQEIGPVPGLSTHEFVPPQESTYRLHPELTHDFGAGKEPPLERFDVETTEEVELRSSGASEFRVPNAAEDFMDLAARMNPRDAGLPSIPEPPVSAELVPEPRIGIPPRRVEEPPVPRAEVVPAPVAAPAPARAEQPVSPPPAGRSQPSYSARETKGQSVASFFQALLAARPPGSGNSTPPPVSGSDQAGASPSAQDGLAVSFGQDSHPKAPAVPAGGPLKDAAVSFDDFFSSAGGGSPTPEGGDPKNEDLDSFQSWLQNLKR
jgi:hypothetical protein